VDVNICCLEETLNSFKNGSVVDFGIDVAKFHEVLVVFYWFLYLLPLLFWLIIIGPLSGDCIPPIKLTLRIVILNFIDSLQ
jgi:hypothetical protein